MLVIPRAIVCAYQEALARDEVPLEQRAHYVRWVRYFLDFCHKYNHDPAASESFLPFEAKLIEKHQADWQRQQARRAVALYHRLCIDGSIQSESQAAGTLSVNRFESSQHQMPHGSAGNTNGVGEGDPEQYAPATSVNRSHQADLEATSAGSTPSPMAPHDHSSTQGANRSWVWVFDGLKSAIAVRHYSQKTLQAYRYWVQRLQTFVRSKDPALLDMEDVKAFLSDLATRRKVAASSQNQAFNALLFLFRHVLEKPFENIEGVVRAKRRRYIPVVLSRDEVERVFGYLSHPYDLIARLLYGCGLRLFECMKLRVQDVNFDVKILTVHDGKGQKDRTVPLPLALLPDLQAQRETVIRIHQQDVEAGYAGTFLPTAVERKYKNAPRELVWQWYFPASALTRIPGADEQRRYHLHESAVQKAIKAAVTKAQIPKRVSAHTFRHSFASHLLQANYDISTIQKLLGHSDVRTTMIYTQTVPSTTLKEAKSPLDF